VGRPARYRTACPAERASSALPAAAGWHVPKLLTRQLKQVAGAHHGLGDGAATVWTSKIATPYGPQTTGSPSIVKDVRSRTSAAHDRRIALVPVTAAPEILEAVRCQRRVDRIDYDRVVGPSQPWIAVLSNTHGHTPPPAVGLPRRIAEF
jgi:hypothetical protein